MRIKVALLLCFVFCLSNATEASSYKPVKATRVIQPAASRIVSSSYYNNETINEDYFAVIEKLKKELENQPDNFEIVISLIDCYINVKKYDLALEYLSYLLEQKQNENLPQETLYEISKLKNKTINKNKYTKYKSPIFVCISYMNLILDEYEKAQNSIKYAVANATNKLILANGIDRVLDYSNNPNEAISICNSYLSLYKNDTRLDDENAEAYNIVFNKKLTLLADNNNIDKGLDTYKELSKENTNLSKDAQYKTFLMMVEKGLSDKEIVQVFYDNEKESLETGYYNLYTLLLEFNDNVNAQIWLDKMEDKFPKSIKVKLAIASLLIKQERTNEATEYLNSIKNELTNEKEIAEYNNLISQLASEPINEAAKLANSGHFQQAIDILEKSPQTADTLATIGRYKVFQKKFDEAIVYLNKAIALDENNVNTLCQLCFYYCWVDDYTTAKKYINKAQSIEPEHEYVKKLIADMNRIEAETFTSKIASALDAQNYNEAMNYINQALKIDPNSSNMYFYKGLTYIAQSNFAASTAALYKSIELDNNNVLPYYYLGIAFDNLSEPDNAVVYYKKFLQLVPKDAYDESERVQFAQTRIQKILSSK